jgi:hypothetical protein
LHRHFPLLVAAPTYHVSLHEAEQLVPLLISDHERRQQHTGLVGISRHRLGEGEAYYIAAEFFTAYHRTQYPGLRNLLKDVLDQALPNPQLRSEAFGTVEITVRRREKELLVHLVETSPGRSLAQNCAFIEQVPLTEAIELDLALPEEPSMVRLQPEDAPLDHAWNDGRLRLTVPGFHLHALVAISLGGPPVDLPADE